MPATPAGWLQFLEPKLDAQAAKARVFENYYNGIQRLGFSSEKFQEVFGGQWNAFADNWCELAVDAAVERLRVDGFRFGGKDTRADQDAWAVWQANGLDAQAELLHTEAVKCGRAFTLLEPPATDEPSRVYVEHPTQVYVHTAPGRPQERLAALKKWVGDDGYLYAFVYLPDGVFKFRSQQRAASTAGGRTNWATAFAFEVNPFEVVPVVPFFNRPTMLEGGRSDLASVLSLQNVINKLVADLVIDSETVAFPQRVVAGWTPPINPETGQPFPDAELKAIRAKVWAFKDKDTKVHELSGADLTRHVEPIREMIRHLAAQTRTPPHYLLGDIVNASGDALKAAESGLASRVRRKHLHFSDPWEETMRLAFKGMGDQERSQRIDAETLWRNPEIRSEAELVDAAVKLRALGVPEQASWEFIGATPQQIRQWLTLREQEALEASILGDDADEPEAERPTELAGLAA